MYIPIKALLAGQKQRRDEIDRAAGKICSYQGSKRVQCVVGDGIYEKGRLDFTPYLRGGNDKELSGLINDSFACIAHRVLSERKEITGLYTSGGDITLAVYEKLDADGIALIKEVLPLAACGRLSGGARERLNVVTKGGMVGDLHAMCARETLFGR